MLLLFRFRELYVCGPIIDVLLGFLFFVLPYPPLYIVSSFSSVSLLCALLLH